MTREIVYEWNPQSVERAIYECTQRINEGALKTNKAHRALLDAERAYDLAYAKAYMRALDNGLPAHAARYQATLDTERERVARDASEAAYKVCDRQMKALNAELDAWRSIGTSVRQAYSTAGVREG